MSVLNGEVRVFDQHGGAPIELRVFGDEFYARYETMAGYTVVYDVEQGVYCYARLANGRFVSTGVPAVKPPPRGLRRHLKEDPDVRNRRFGQRYEQLRPPEPAPDDAFERTLGPDGGLLSGRKLFEGDILGLTVLVDFDDVRSNVRAADVEALLNGENYRAHGNFCSVNEYFKRVSGGRLNYRNRVVGPVRLSGRRSQYISTLLVDEVMERVVDDLGVDLSAFDSRGEGIVDALTILYAGRSQYNGKLWPHNAVRSFRHAGVRTHFYLLTGLGRVAADLRIGTICHESGHLLCRFPDMYDYGERDGDGEKSEGIGVYCLMGSGNHLDRRRTPAPVCAYLRYLAGWAEEVVLLNDRGEFSVRHGDYARVHKYETDVPNEYFLVENRTAMGLDKALPSSGLAVYHCDTQGSNEWQGGGRVRHYQCALLQADGHLDLENGRNRGDAGDLFREVDGVALSDQSTPDTRMWSGVDSGLVIAAVGAPGEVMRFRVGAAAVEPNRLHAETFPDMLIPDDDAAGIDSVLRIGRDGLLRAIEVEIAIVHSWIGDLSVVLMAPDDSAVVLHDREGRSGDDIRRRYTPDDTPALHTLVDKPIRGNWRLHVVDSAGQDVGVLESWSLDIDFEPGLRWAEAESRPERAIPDDDAAGIVERLTVAEAGAIRDLDVSLDISHGYIGDLRIELVSPNGTPVLLHDEEGGGRGDLKRVYRLEDLPALEALRGEPGAGEWRLRVADRAALDTGTLNRWGLRVGY